MDSGEKNIFAQPLNSAGNPFSNKSSANSFSPKKSTTRLNGYDSNILNKSNLSDAEEQELSLDFRIKEKESLLKDLDEKIKLADNYGTQNESLGLKAKKQRVSQELSLLKRQQASNGLGLSKINGHSGSVLKEKLPAVYKVGNFVSRNILAKVSKKVRSFVDLTDSLEQLSDISKSVDELVDMNIPYGEKVQNYEKLTQYLSKANAIHSRIAKSLGK